MIFKVAVLSSKSMKWVSVLLCMKLLCTLFVIFVFSRFSPLIDADLYLSGFYVDDVLRTRIIQGIVNMLLSLGSSVFVHWIFGVLSLTGLLYYYFLGGTRWQVFFPLLLPSTLIWTSVIGKEAIFYGAFTLALVIWARFVVQKCILRDFIFLAVSVAICALFRPHYAVVIFWLFVSIVMIEKLKVAAGIWLCLLALFAVSIICTFVWEPLLWRGFGGIEPEARASRFVILGIEPKTHAGFAAYKSLLPLGALLGITGPMPTELFERPVFIPFFLEGLLVMFFPMGVYLYAINQFFDGKKQFVKIFWISLVPAILALVALHAPFGFLNPGSAIRWRVNFEAAFHMAPLLLFFEFLDDDRSSNNSLPS